MILYHFYFPNSSFFVFWEAKQNISNNLLILYLLQICINLMKTPHICLHFYWIHFILGSKKQSTFLYALCFLLLMIKFAML